MALTVGIFFHQPAKMHSKISWFTALCNAAVASNSIKKMEQLLTLFFAFVFLSQEKHSQRISAMYLLHYWTEMTLSAACATGTVNVFTIPTVYWWLITYWANMFMAWHFNVPSDTLCWQRTCGAGILSTVRTRWRLISYWVLHIDTVDTITYASMAVLAFGQHERGIECIDLDQCHQ